MPTTAKKCDKHTHVMWDILALQSYDDRFQNAVVIVFNSRLSYKLSTTAFNMYFHFVLYRLLPLY